MNRLLESVLATGATVVAMPVVCSAAALVMLDGSGPLFIQERLGKGRQPFRVLKLRTMKDGRVTRIGRLLRASGIDELPQLLHVIRGEMALVGPRPLTQADVTRLGWDDARYDARWTVAPGITGPAQLHGGPCDKRISWVYDRDYVRRASTIYDLKLLASSALVTLLGKRRVRAIARQSRASDKRDVTRAAPRVGVR